jgi:hypothetical protein
MISTSRTAQHVDELLRRFASALRASQLYSSTHPLVARNLALFHETVVRHLAAEPSLTFAMVGDEIVVGDTPVPKAVATMGDLMRRLKSTASSASRHAGVRRRRSTGSSSCSTGRWRGPAARSTAPTTMAAHCGT